MKNFFTLFKGKKAARQAAAVATAESSDSVKIEAIQLIAEVCVNVPTDEEVHIKMVFNEAGEMMACNVDHYREEEPLGLSTASTLVEKTPSPRLAKPASPLLPAFSQALPVADLKRAAAARLATMTPAPTLRTEDFRVIQVLGKGGQGTVLLVQYQGDGRLYALKVIKKAAVSIGDYPFAFQEQDTSKTLAGNHFFAQLKASFEDEDYFYLLSDFYPGGDLADRIYNVKKLDVSQARLYCAQLILALDELHRRRIMHRDIKPQNVLITNDNEAVLADFGLTRMYGRSPTEQPWRLQSYWEHPDYVFMPHDEVTGEALDATRRFCGTVPYLAPEASTGEAYAYPSDVWSMGIVFYEMLNGKLPFGMDGSDRDPRSIAKRIRCGVVEVNEDVDVDAHDLLYMMLEKEPSRRPSLEQIKEHPWFAPIDWNQLSQHKQPRPIRLAEGVKPTKEALEVKFGIPYPAGDAPHPWYQWVSPNLQTSKPSAKCSRKTSATRQAPTSPMLSAFPQPGSPLPPSLTAYFAPRALPASPAFPAFFAPPSHGGRTLVRPTPPASARSPASSSLSATRPSYTTAPVCLSPSDRPQPCMRPAPAGPDALRPLLGRSVCSVETDSPFVEDTRPALETPHAAGVVNVDTPAAPVHPAPARNARNAVANMDAPTRDAPRVRYAPRGHVLVTPSWDAFKLAADSLLIADWPAARLAAAPIPSTMTTDVTRVDSPFDSRTSESTRATTPEHDASRSWTRSALAPNARERCPWAVPRSRASRPTTPNALDLAPSAKERSPWAAPSFRPRLPESRTPSTVDLAPKARERCPWAVPRSSHGRA